MTDWKAVAMAVARAQGRFWSDLVELAFDRKTAWDQAPRVLGERIEASQQMMLADWRAAGVAMPMTLYGTVAVASTALWMLALMKAPGPTLRTTCGLGLVGAAYGMTSVLTRRSERGPVQPMTEPVTMPEEGGSPFRSADW